MVGNAIQPVAAVLTGHGLRRHGRRVHRQQRGPPQHVGRPQRARLGGAERAALPPGHPHHLRHRRQRGALRHRRGRHAEPPPRHAGRAPGAGGPGPRRPGERVDVLASSYPPSAGAFREDLAQYVRPLLDFHAEVGSPFLVNAYPFFAYKASPGSVSLPYVLFEPNPGARDPGTNLTYDNMLYAQIDAVYAAMEAMGHTDVAVRISETGWPSDGDADEVGATVQNAATYNGNLMKRVAAGQGTPLRPDLLVFALFNENMKPGPASERNYGLFYPNGTSVYDLGFDGASFGPSPTASGFSSSSKPTFQ